MGKCVNHLKQSTCGALEAHWSLQNRCAHAPCVSAALQLFLTPLKNKTNPLIFNNKSKAAHLLLSSSQR